MFGIPAGIAIVALLLVTAIQASKHKDEFTYSTSALTTVKVKVLVIDTLPYSTGTCYTGLTGYEDIHAGTVVTLSGDAGRTLGSAPLSVESGAGQGTCNFVAHVTGVPVDQSSYSVSGGGPQRGRITESGARLSRDGWTFSLQW